MRILKAVSFLAGALCFAGVVAQAGAQQMSSLASVPATGDAAGRCAALLHMDGSVIVDAPTQILSAKLYPAQADMPEFCEVRGYVRAHVQFALRMPTKTWNSKLLQTGCGGYCGMILIDSDRENSALKRGYAVTNDDMGHVGNAFDAEWAYNNIEGKIDFGYRATHVNAVAAKAILKEFYSTEQKHAYFQGCSTGGRQAVVEAQKYPDDFDGIIAGAPALYYTTSNFQLLWVSLAGLDEKDQPIMLPQDLVNLHKAVLDKCDAMDGLKDGIIEDPRKCNFDPAVIECSATKTTDCLTAKQVEAVRKIYAGPSNSKGPIHVGSALPGSELNWLHTYIGEAGQPPTYKQWMINKFRYMTFFEDPGPNWTLKDLDWERDPARAEANGAIYSGSNPDLHTFKDHGGKMIAYQGWADQSVAPGQWLTYYGLVDKTMGGRQPTQEFLRLFMIPGMNHCAGGVGADTVDYLTYLEDWVEKGKAPESMVGSHIEKGATTFSRPYFPYPDVSRWSGKGDVNDAANWVRVGRPDGQ
jgi:hypothetical protein